MSIVTVIYAEESLNNHTVMLRTEKAQSQGHGSLVAIHSQYDHDREAILLSNTLLSQKEAIECIRAPVWVLESG